MKNDRMKAQPFDCMQYFYGAVQEPRIRCLIRFQGAVSETVLKRAAGLSIGAVPLIGCIFDDKHHCWRKRGFTGEDIVHVAKYTDESDDAAFLFLMTGIDHTREPQVKITLLRGKTDDALCIVINHMVCDGAGFKEYLYLLGELYTRCEKGEDLVQPVPVGRRDLGQLLQNLSFGKKLRILFSRPHFSKPDPTMVMPAREDSSTPMIVTASIEKDQFDKVRCYAKNSRVSINDILLTAYLRALRRATGCEQITVPCPVDLRKYKKPEQRCGICNLTGNYICSTDISPDEAFGVTLRKVSNQMQAQKTDNACLKGPMLFDIMFHTLPIRAVRSLFYSASPVPVTSYTNLGVLDEGKLRFGNRVVENAVISTAVKKSPYFQLSVSTFRGCCTLTSSFYGSDTDGERIREFLNRIVEEITGLTEV